MLTPEQRKAEFDALFARLPGPKNIDRIRQVCAALYCKENTVRQWRMTKPVRIIPESKLMILRREVEQRAS